MNSIAITIAEEFLRSPNPQIRKNSLVALAVVDEEESGQVIADTALTDEDWTVRQRAKSELLSGLAATAPVIPAAVEDVLVRALKSDDAQKQKRAYAILGQLKSQGFFVPQVRIKFGNRMWLASTLYFSYYVNRNWSFRLRKWKPGLIGTLIGATPLIVYASKSFETVSTRLIGVVLLLLGFSLLGTLVSVLATQFLTPINMHLRPVSASIVQIVETFLNVLAGTIILQIILSFVVGRFLEYAPISVDFFAIFILIFSLLSAFARLGTILTFGHLKFLRIGNVRTRNLIVQTLGGTAVAFIITTFIYLPLWAPSRSMYERHTLTNIWLGCISIAMGLAAAFASIDNEALPLDGRISKQPATN